MTDVALIGAGPMAMAYAAVLKDIGTTTRVIGRGEKSAATFKEKTGLDVRTGGLEDYLASGEDLPDYAIISTPVDALAPNAKALIAAGIKNILVEKPAGVTPEETLELADFAASHSANVYVAYNRRYYSSVLAAKKLIKEDGGATSLRMEFSEFAFRIKDVPTAAHIKSQWLYANSTHVLDMGFFLAGYPMAISGMQASGSDWHPAGSQFVGHGRLDNGGLFSYHADWDAAPRWMVEVMTPKRTLMFNPLEKLNERSPEGFAITPVELEDDLDTRFKPGLYKQTEAFLKGETADLATIASHAHHMEDIYKVIRGA